jgi:hypothetical protein
VSTSQERTRKRPTELHRCVAVGLRSSQHAHTKAAPIERECGRTSSGTKGACGPEARCLSAGEAPYPRCFSGSEPTLHCTWRHDSL